MKLINDCISVAKSLFFISTGVGFLVTWNKLLMWNMYCMGILG